VPCSEEKGVARAGGNWREEVGNPHKEERQIKAPPIDAERRNPSTAWLAVPFPKSELTEAPSDDFLDTESVTSPLQES